MGRLCAALLMVPAFLMLGGLAGETMMRLVRGYPLNALAAVTSLGAAAVYAWQFWSLARSSKTGPHGT